MEIEALLTVIKDKPPQQLIHELGRNSPTLKELNRSFIEASEQIQILSAFETLETPTVEYDVSHLIVKHTDTGRLVITSLTDVECTGGSEQTSSNRKIDSPRQQRIRHRGSEERTAGSSVRQSLYNRQDRQVSGVNLPEA
jgi:hypothetical protein